MLSKCCVWHEWHRAKQSPTPDSCWPLLRDTVKAVAQSHFRKGCWRQQLRPPDTQVELQEQHRCKLAIQHSPKAQVPEGAGQLHTLAACLQQWHLSAQYTNARDFRQVWQAAGTLSGRQIGPNRRKYDSPPTRRPSLPDCGQSTREVLAVKAVASPQAHLGIGMSSCIRVRILLGRQNCYRMPAIHVRFSSWRRLPC